MSTASWHVEGSRLAAYARGDVDDAEAFSVEAHIVGCASCQAAVADGSSTRRGSRRTGSRSSTRSTRPGRGSSRGC